MVHEFDLKHIKRELKEENGEGEKDCGLDLEKLIQVPLQHNMFLRSEDSSLESVRSLISRYSAVAKRRGYHLVGSEPMLIVQCPGCCAEFRGLTNRMLRLVNHVTEQHQPSMHSRLISQIEKRYGALIEIIKTRLQKWIKRKNAVK